MATQTEVDEVVEAMNAGAVDMLLIAHSDGRVTCRTHHDPPTTGNWLIALGNMMLGETAWPTRPDPEPEEADEEPAPDEQESATA